MQLIPRAEAHLPSARATVDLPLPGNPRSTTTVGTVAFLFAPGAAAGSAAKSLFVGLPAVTAGQPKSTGARAAIYASSPAVEVLLMGTRLLGTIVPLIDTLCVLSEASTEVSEEVVVSLAAVGALSAVKTETGTAVGAAEVTTGTAAASSRRAFVNADELFSSLTRQCQLQGGHCWWRTPAAKSFHKGAPSRGLWKRKKEVS